MTRLEFLRYDLGLTPEQFAERLKNVSATTVRRAERGQRLQPSKAKTIADHLGIAPSEIYEEVEPARAA